MGKLGLLPLLLVVVAAVSSLSVYQVKDAADVNNKITYETVVSDAKAILGANENEYVDYLLSKGWKRAGNVWSNGNQSIIVTEQIGIVTKVDIIK